MIARIPNPKYQPERKTQPPLEGPGEAASKIESAFIFSDTAEGHAFWHGVCERLRQISADGVLR